LGKVYRTLDQVACNLAHFGKENQPSGQSYSLSSPIQCGLLLQAMPNRSSSREHT
jgi:hypothetical protein